MINPPTDNLYKFCAIVGLFLIVFNSYYALELFSKTTTDLINLAGDKRKYLLELTLHEEKAKKLNEELENSINIKKEFSKKQQAILDAYRSRVINKKLIQKLESDLEYDRPSYIRNNKFVDSLNLATNKEAIALDIKQIEIDTKSELIKHEQIKSEIYRNYLYYGSLLGITIAVYGFFNWFKIQKTIDKSLNPFTQ